MVDSAQRGSMVQLFPAQGTHRDLEQGCWVEGNWTVYDHNCKQDEDGGC